MNPEQQTPLLVFRLGEQRYALMISTVIEVAAMVQLTTVPDARPALLGVANRHGEALPIIDLRCVFGLESLPIDATTLFIVVEYRKQRVGLVVDEVFQVKYVERSALKSAPGHGQYINHIISDDTSIIQIISLPPILNQYLPTFSDSSEVESLL